MKKMKTGYENYKYININFVKDCKLILKVRKIKNSAV
jgi:hypothetical protein